MYFFSIYQVDFSSEDNDAMDVDKPAQKSASKPKDPNDLSEYNLDNYDNEPNECMSQFNANICLSLTILALGPFSSINNLKYYKDDADDPYIKLNEVRST